MENKMIVLFGSTGDLTKKKILPAISSLYENNNLGRVACIGRRDITTQHYLGLMGLNPNSKLAENLDYINTSFKNHAQFADKINELKIKYKTKEIIFYLATSSELFVPIIEFLHKSGLLVGKFKAAFEKPFGLSLKDAEELHKKISKHVPAEAMYFSDHYLVKDMVHDLPKIKALKPLAEIWEKECAESV